MRCATLIRPALAAAPNAGKLRLQAQHFLISLDSRQLLKHIHDRVMTITFDNELEFATHERIAMALGAGIYFANPYCSWERGANQKANGLIRQYFPKGTDFNEVTDVEIEAVTERLKNRTRETRRFKSPNKLFMTQ